MDRPGAAKRRCGSTPTQISRRHVELGVDSHEGWFARDAGSTGGFYIGGQHAGGQRHPLHAGMVLELGGDGTS